MVCSLNFAWQYTSSYSHFIIIIKYARVCIYCVSAFFFVHFLLIHIKTHTERVYNGHKTKTQFFFFALLVDVRTNKHLSRLLSSSLRFILAQFSAGLRYWDNVCIGVVCALCSLATRTTKFRCTVWTWNHSFWLLYVYMGSSSSHNHRTAKHTHTHTHFASQINTKW